MRDNVLGKAVSVSIAPQATTAAVNGSSLDLAGTEAVAAVIAAGTITAGDTLTFHVEESDDNVSFAAAAAGDLIGDVDSGANTITFADTEDNTVKIVGYVGNKRYVRVALAEPGAGTDGVSAVFVQERQRHVGSLA